MGKSANTPVQPAPVHQEAAVRGLRTGVQSVVGLVVGLLGAVWVVPGVPQAVAHYLLDNLLPVALAVGVPSAIAGYVYNLVRPR